MNAENHKLMSEELKSIEVSAPQDYFLSTSQDVNLFMAGIGSGKSHVGGIISVDFIKNFPMVDGFIGANTYKQLNDSTMKRIKAVWREYFGLIEGVHYVSNIKPPKHFNTKGHDFDSYDGIISFVHGTVVYKGSLDNALAHEGKEFGWAILDETKDSRESDVKEIIVGRLRQKGMVVNGKEWNPLFILTSPAKVRWINEWFDMDNFEAEITSQIYSKETFFKKEYKDKCLVISSTYHNEHNLPKGYIQRVIDNNTTENGNRLIYANPFSTTGGEFYSGFDRKVHVKDVELLEELPIHITFDQNVVPYITMNCFQTRKIKDVYEVRQFAEFCLENPQNTTEQICREFIRVYGTEIFDLFYYGDPSGRKRDTRGRENDYDIVERVLRAYLNNASDRTRKNYPGVTTRRDFMNNILEGKYKIRYIIDREKCPNTIADYMYLKQDRDR